MQNLHSMRFSDDRESRSLSQAIVAVMRTRGMSPPNVAERMGSGRNRATLYRILSGATRDPKLSTFLDICQALEVSPIEVLQLAGLVRHQPRETDLLEIRLRQIFRKAQVLPEAFKRLVVTQFGMIVDSVEDFEKETRESPGEQH